MSTAPNRVAVGVDGTEASNDAIRWAAHEAVLRGVALRIVNIFTAKSASSPWGAVTWIAQRPDDAREQADEIVRDAIRIARAGKPMMEVDGEAVEGERAATLLAEAELAGLLVIGSRRLGPFGSVVLGSVGTAVTASAQVPVVVARGPDLMNNEESPVIVGIDGTESSRYPLEFAFDYAQRHRIALRALVCWHPHFYQPSAWLTDAAAAGRAKAEEWAAAALAGWQDKYPDVTTSCQVVDEHPADGLSAASPGANLLVVGNHHRHEPRRALLGSVSLGVLHHADCPVAVVPLQNKAQVAS